MISRRSPHADCSPPSAACGAGASMCCALTRQRGGGGGGLLTVRLQGRVPGGREHFFWRPAPDGARAADSAAGAERAGPPSPALAQHGIMSLSRVPAGILGLPAGEGAFLSAAKRLAQAPVANEA